MSTGPAPDELIPASAAPGRNARAERAWNAVLTWVRKEPAATQALIVAFIAIGIAFQWWHWSNGQTGAVIGITAALLAMLVRSQVTPLSKPAPTGRRPAPTPDEHKTATSAGH